MSIGVVILAAGKGTRMRSDLPKVLHQACGRSLLEWAISETDLIDPTETTIVIGHRSDLVTSACPDGAAVVVQEPQLGTGHAVDVGLSGLSDAIDTVVVLPGDMPLIRPESIKALVDEHRASGYTATIMSVFLEDPTGYGRIVREETAVVGIVEHRDASPEQRGINEVNTSVYVFDRARLEAALALVTDDNDQGEYYLTDVIGILVGDGHAVGAMPAGDDEGMGVNDHAQLADAAARLRSRINHAWMVAGVKIAVPDRTIIEPDVVLEPGATILQDCWLRGGTTVAADAVVGPQVEALDTSIGSGAMVRYCVADNAVVGTDTTVGPYTYLRPGTVLEDGAKAGGFVEIKGSTVGKGSKVPHLSYIGDAEIGEDTNIGAATVTVNYDGENKHPTKIGDRVRVGSDTMLVAPVTIGDDAFTGAGSVITRDVPDGALGIERSDQRNIEGYSERRRKRAEEEAD